MRINLETLHYQLLIIFTFFIICKSIQDQESEEYDLMEYITPNKRYTTDFPRKVCGSSLTDAVLYHCRGIINKKKSDPYYNTKWNLENEPETGNELDLYFPMIPKFRAQNAVRFQRQRRGIVEECCYKGCTNAEIQTYCRRNY